MRAIAAVVRAPPDTAALLRCSCESSAATSAGSWRPLVCRSVAAADAVVVLCVQQWRTGICWRLCGSTRCGNDLRAKVTRTRCSWQSPRLPVARIGAGDRWGLVCGCCWLRLLLVTQCDVFTGRSGASCCLRSTTPQRCCLQRRLRCVGERRLARCGSWRVLMCMVCMIVLQLRQRPIVWSSS